MKIRTRMNALKWRLRTRAFGVEGGVWKRDPVVRVAPFGMSLRPVGRMGRLGVLALVAVPAILLGTEFARNTGNGSLLPDAGARSGEVASLRASLDRYYSGRDGDHVGLSGREIALSVTVSGYTSRPCETDSTPFVTAANTTTRRGVIALSRDLVRRYTADAPFDFGDVVHLNGIGDFVVEDVMAGRWERHADIWFESVGEAKLFGRRRAVLTGPYGPGDAYQASQRGVAQVASGRGGAAP